MKTQVNKSQERTVELTESELARLLRRAFSMDQYLTVTEAAEYVRVGKIAVYRWIKEERIHAYAPIPGKMVVKKADLDGLVRRSRVDPEEGTGMHEAGREGLKAWHARRRAAAQEQEQRKEQEATA